MPETTARPAGAAIRLETFAPSARRSERTDRRLASCERCARQPQAESEIGVGTIAWCIAHQGAAPVEHLTFAPSLLDYAE